MLHSLIKHACNSEPFCMGSVTPRAVAVGWQCQLGTLSPCVSQHMHLNPDSSLWRFMACIRLYCGPPRMISCCLGTLTCRMETRIYNCVHLVKFSCHPKSTSVITLTHALRLYGSTSTTPEQVRMRDEGCKMLIINMDHLLAELCPHMTALPPAAAARRSLALRMACQRLGGNTSRTSLSICMAFIVIGASAHSSAAANPAARLASTLCSRSCGVC